MSPLLFGDNVMPKDVNGFQDNLTHRECEVLRTYARADTVFITAKQLNISQFTVKNTLATIFKRLGVINARQAIYEHYVLERGRLYCYIDHRDS
jgi:DNA-binding CsgD family transcriptional regulator